METDGGVVNMSELCRSYGNNLVTSFHARIEIGFETPRLISSSFSGTPSWNEDHSVFRSKDRASSGFHHCFLKSPPVSVIFQIL